jgi:hypothetical protein
MKGKKFEIAKSVAKAVIDTLTGKFLAKLAKF